MNNNQQYPYQQSPYSNQNTTSQNKKKNMSNEKFVILIVTFILVGLVVSGTLAIFIFYKFFLNDNGASAERNQEWIDKMNETFPDDEFAFVSYAKYGSVFGVATSKKSIFLSSKKFPGKNITIGWNDDMTELVTDYNFVRYIDALDKYYTDKMYEYFDADDIRTDFMTYYPRNLTPVVNYSFDEFVQKRAGCDINVFLKYVGDFPSEEEMTKAVDRIIADIDLEITMDVYLTHDKMDYTDKVEGDEMYYLVMDGTKKIVCLKHSITHFVDGDTTKRKDINTTIYEDKDLD